MAETGRTGARVADSISADILAQGEKIMAARLAEAMPEVLEKMDVSLFDLSEQSTDGELKRLYQTLQSELRSQRGPIMFAFPNALRAEFTKLGIPGLHAAGGEKPDSSIMALSLVEFDDMEESLGVSGLASNLRNACSAELRDLGIRVAHLLGVRELRDQDNPYGPDVVASVFKQVLSPIAGIKSRLTLLQLVSKIFPEILSALYGELNTYLVSKGVVPDIKLRAKASGTQAAVAPTGQRPSPVADTGHAPLLAEGDGAEVGDLFGSLQQLIMMNMGRQGAPGLPTLPHAGGDIVPGGGAFPVISMAGMPMQVTGELLKSLTHLQHGEIDALPQTGEGVAGVFDPSQLALGTVNLLRNIRDAGLYNPASQVDAITIDVVAMLFDFVFDDKDIPAPVRVLIGRLQIPVLKAAMLDKKFFSRKDNPARKLLDKLAQVSVAWSGEVSEDDPLYLRIAAVVHDVIDNFEEDSSIFERAVEQLELYIAEEENQAEERSKTTAEALYKREIAEFAQVLAQEEIVKRAQDVPQEIRQFLMNYWLDILVAAYESEGEGGEAWKSGLGVVDDLAWSLEPKIQQEDRLRLVRTLPQLLKRIESAMRRKSAADDEIKAFSTKLVEFHITALKGLAQPQQNVPATEKLESDAVASVEESGTETTGEGGQEEPAASLAAVAPPSDEAEIGVVKWTLPTKDLTAEDDYDRMAKQLKKGCWMEFTLDNDTRLRVKLTWVSPMKGVMLFTERDGSNAVKISPRSLAKRFRAGTAVVLGDASLVERAVTNVMDQLKKNVSPEALPVAE